MTSSENRRTQMNARGLAPDIGPSPCSPLTGLAYFIDTHQASMQSPTASKPLPLQDFPVETGDSDNRLTVLRFAVEAVGPAERRNSLLKRNYYAEAPTNDAFPK